MTSRISYNVHCTSKNFDKNKLYTHLQKLRPTWVLCMDGLQVCRDIKAMLPECNVIHRAWPDEEFWKSTSPADWVAAKREEIGDADVWCYTVNEQAMPDNLCNWMTQAIEFAAAQHLKIVVGNPSVGTPAPEQWRSDAALRMLRALDKYRANAVLGLHEYCLLTPTSGVIGGYPDAAGVPGGQKGGMNLVPAANWPSPENMKTFTCFHMSRFKFMTDACKANKIPLPRVVITEWGFDDVSDIKAWAQQQPMTPPYTSIRGWKSLPNAWKKFYPQWTAQETMFHALSWADRAMYQGTCVEGQLIFSWGASSDKWDQFDTSQSREFQNLLEIAAASPVPVPPPPVPVPLPPAPITWIKARAFIKSGDNHVALYTLANTSTGQLANISDGDALDYDSVGMIAGWWRVRYQNKVGYVESAYFQPVPPIIVVPPDEPPPVNEGGYSKAELARQIVIYQQASDLFNELCQMATIAHNRAS